MTAMPTVMPNVSVGDNLRRVRSDLGLSLAQVSARAGISVATLSRIETEKQKLDVDLLTRLAGILEIPRAEILGDSADNDPSAVTRKLARMPAKERARVFFDASRRGAASIEDLLSVIDVLRDELSRLQRPGGRRKR